MRLFLMSCYHHHKVVRKEISRVLGFIIENWDVLWTYHFYGLVPWEEGDAVGADDLGLLVIPFSVEHVALLAHDQCCCHFIS